MAISQWRQQFDEALNRTLDRTVRLAVTGLSRSGKTVFITSLVQQLLHGADNPHLPFFKVAGDGRLCGTKPQIQPDLHIPAFRYDLAINDLTANPPRWTEPTNGISEIRLAIRYKPSSQWIHYFSPVNTLYLDIIDYPGEWLLDLPLLEWSFEEWSRQMALLCDQPPRNTLSLPWRSFVDNIDITQTTNETTLRQASELYTQFLLACKEKKYGLTLLQPGRFTMPGDLKGAPLLEFCPLLKIPVGTKSEDSFYGIMKKRYESYKEHVVNKFYKDHFSNFDRQIVLVDVLKAFNTGFSTFVDMREAIHLVLKSFHYGKTGFFSRLFGLQSNVDRLLFAATKADHVTPNQLPNLERFLQLMLMQANNNARFEGVETETLALSALQCTTPVSTLFQGKPLSCIKGIPNNSEKPLAIFPGEIPTDIPPPEEWTTERFHFVDFRPPPLPDIHSRSLPHLRMDRALEFLLGDKFA
ncbi:MAG: hypothetical protein RIT27_1777 [Pseudomonadota bacterium]